MALPPQAKFWLVRLRALNQLGLWCALLAVGLLAIALREYRQHPEWVGQFETDDEKPGQLAAEGIELTPEEEARLADIDNSAALLAEFGLSPLPAAAPATETAPSETLLSVIQDLDESSLGLELPTPENESSPFEPYLQEYRFGAAGPRQPNSATSSSGSLLFPQNPFSSEPSASPSTAPTPAAQASPLEQALRQQTASQATTTTEAPVDPQAASRTSISNLNPNLPGQTGLQQGTIPGSNVRFNLSAPQMSPPPGTTGYVPPVVAPQPLPPVSVNGVPPTIPAATPATPNLSAPNLQTPAQYRSNPYGIAPSSPIPQGSSYQAPNLLVPEVNSSIAPRQPGSFVGGGYINTFSDPAGYID